MNSPILICILFLCSIKAFSETISYNGKAYWINGVNIPWNQFGTDAGSHVQWQGAGYDPDWFETFYAECESKGINCVRLWVHCDGRSSPEFGANGSVTGLDPTFLDDLEDNFARANNHKVMVMPCLWSFDMTNDNMANAGPYGGNHHDLIQDSSKTMSYIDNTLIPMLERFAQTPNLFAWEIINEPEWSIEGSSGSTDHLVTKTEMQRFCAMIAETIHQHTDKMVTIGSACLKWNSDNSPPAEENWWADSALQAAYNSADAYLDFYQIHYYDWMYDPAWGYDPFQLTKPTTFWNLDKPTIIGECPGDNSGQYPIGDQINNGYLNGYAGIMFWSYNSDYKNNWNDISGELKIFRDLHPDIIDYSGVSKNINNNVYPPLFCSSQPFHSWYNLIGRRILELPVTDTRNMNEYGASILVNGNQISAKLLQIKD